MPKYEAKESSFELLDEGSIVAGVVAEIEFKEFDTYNRLNWRVELTEGELKGYKIFGSTSEKFSVDPPSKFYEWACALLGRVIEVGEAIDTDDLIGLPCRVVIMHKPDADDENRMWMRIESIEPPRGAPTTTAESVFG